MSTTRQLPGFAVTGTGTRQGQLAGFSWSDETSTGTAVSVNVTDVSTASAIGTVSVLGKSLTTLSNVVATGYISSVIINGKALTNLTGVQATGAVTDVVVTGKALVNLSGVAVSGYISSVSVISGTAAQVTGISATGSVAAPTALGKAKVNLSAVLTTSALGTVTIYEPPVPQSINGDPDFSYVSLLLPFDGANGSTTFYDASPVPKAITTVGNTNISTAQSKFGGSSAYFNGSGDYLTVADSNDFAFGSSDFTIECWIYPTVSPGSFYKGIVGQRNLYTSDNSFLLVIFGDGRVQLDFSTTGTSITHILLLGYFSLNNWHHLAVARSGNTIKGFVNGVLGQSLDVTGISLYNSTQLVHIGRLGIGEPGFDFGGYIDSLRITKGLARYTASFTPPTSPFPTDWLDESDPYYDNVVLHLPMDGPENGTTFVDRSKTPKTITTVGNTKLLAAQSKFGGRSAYFDGTGDYLTTTTNLSDFVLGTVDFTIDFWINTTDGNGLIVDFYTSGQYGWQLWLSTGGLLYWYDIASTTISATSIATGVWTHVAIVRTNNNLYTYINGVLDKTTAYTKNLSYQTSAFSVGAQVATRNTSYDFVGYLDSLRITKGVARYTSNFTVPTGPFAVGKPYTVDPYASNVKLLLTGSGAHGSQVIEDKSSVGNTITVAGNASVDRVISKVYGGSIYFDGSGDYLSVPTSSDLQLGSSEFTIEFWAYASSLPSSGQFANFLSKRATATSNFEYIIYLWGASQKINFAYSTNGSTEIYISESFPWTSQWVHVAAVRQSNTIRLYVNGVSTTSKEIIGSIYLGTDDLKVGTSGDLLNYYSGYINNLRITKGTARYTANFTPDYSYLIPLSVQPTLVYVEGVGIVSYIGSLDLSTKVYPIGVLSDAELGIVRALSSISVYVEGVGIVSYIGTLNLSAIVHPIGILTDAELGIGRVAAWGNLGTSQIPNWVLLDDSNISLWRLVDDSQTTDWQTIH